MTSDPQCSTILAPYAVTPDVCRGRIYAESAPRWRSEFQRDRDRVIHSAAFRRLEYKTQVFVNHEGDMFRTRLTHSLEVAQIARTIARALAVNEDLTEAIALAHDLGHTPFGHAGQAALNACMQEYDGFEHNFHSLRVVDLLEERYPEFPGLNLLFETREGILKHCSAQRARQIGELGRRFLDHLQPSLEAQIANVADEIAYNHHDIDDGLRAGLLEIGHLRELSLFQQTEIEVTARWPTLDSKRIRYTVIREMLNHFVSDLITTTRANIETLGISSVDAVRYQSEPLLGFSALVNREHLELKRLLRHQLYEHSQVIEMAERSKGIVKNLYSAYMDSPSSLPNMKVTLATKEPVRAQIVADYIAGMTDRFAIAEYTRIVNARILCTH
ncbi:MAG: deoxyguanosinetriphosphate triphosphohydrolase [Gammaproteobacteria bacterium]|nr:deoxyguanosinetriphosphate triphosphohydrolase [Gammaproteobacteria bacterium]